ncbi:bifunctional precorrin-2 dehydrogenase/sirohydrochlorin ferrochelatase [Paenibacillus allorhizosphaerae]|uniref:precorrin-2 dehydrogenase n=1 Tax=Paenibacillus allorhizosphaerae TaxID=2849866 RepID=A0ABN7TTP0_9BACL|nr:bifunctional precorrin-2 dehydrogenase/sirohydrochlorin ferrochelatase [Paenibacillus allorhizosphaerae]CAG7655404.1 Siroheme synthase [Paenibacillus allorhizosphaerae]
MTGKPKTYYPVMLALNDAPCLVVGGGQVAERKTGALLEAGARVTALSPRFTPQLEAWAAQGTVAALRCRYEPGLPALAAARLVFAATDDASVNAAVRAEAEALGKLVNVADDAEASGFIVPAAVRRGRLTLAVSTAGASPAVAALLRRQLEETFGPEYGPYLELLHELRLAVQREVPDSGVRQELFRAMLGWELLPLLQCAEFAAQEQLRDELLLRVKSDPTTEGIRNIGEWLRLESSKNGL